MKRIKLLLVPAILFFFATNAFSQNWMIMEYYTHMTIDSLIKENYSDDASLIDYGIESYDYDADNESFVIEYYFDVKVYQDTITSYGELDIDLAGGLAMVTDDEDDLYFYELPDLSQYVFVYNETGKQISFSVSCDDKDFSTHSLDVEEFNYFMCDAGNAYIIVVTYVDGKETGRVHYLLEKGKGYKVKWDSANSKFEVYTDNKLDKDN